MSNHYFAGMFLILATAAFAKDGVDNPAPWAFLIIANIWIANGS